MIFVTVGTYSFNNLILEIDGLAGEGFFGKNKVICQIGSGDYLPSNCEYFRYSSSLHKYYENADFIICHGGTGSTSDSVRARKPFIAVANTDLTDNHQVEFLRALSDEMDFLWTDTPSDIRLLYKNAKSCTLRSDIRTLYSNLENYILS